MDIDFPKPGSYVVAVSGGVDSMALLHLLHQTGDYQLVVAHLDHGIREDSSKDRQLVEVTSEKLGLPFVFQEVRLGQGTGEAVARKARYDFLDDVVRSTKAQALITAHHQDDVLETAILNMLRGTNRRGLTSLQSREGRLRPLLKIPKSALQEYAQIHNISWREDASNRDEAYARNYVRHKLLPKFSEADRARLLQIINNTSQINNMLDTLLVNHIDSQSVTGQLDRQWLIMLPHSLVREVLAAWLRSYSVGEFDKFTLERLAVAAKTAVPGRRFPVVSGWQMTVNRDQLALLAPER